MSRGSAKRGHQARPKAGPSYRNPKARNVETRRARQAKIRGEISEPAEPGETGSTAPATSAAALRGQAKPDATAGPMGGGGGSEVENVRSSDPPVVAFPSPNEDRSFVGEGGSLGVGQARP